MSSNESGNPTSTLQSAIDTVTGAAQSAFGALTGSTADQAAGENKKDQAAAEKDLSHAAARAGPFTVSSGGGVAQDNTDRTQGNWDQTVGSGKEMLGGLVGSESLKQEGIKQNQDGKAQQAKGQISDLGQGISDRVHGTVGGAVAGLTGNTEAQEKAHLQHDDGKARQRGVELDLQKQADAQAASKPTPPQ